MHLLFIPQESDVLVTLTGDHIAFTLSDQSSFVFSYLSDEFSKEDIIDTLSIASSIKVLAIGNSFTQDALCYMDKMIKYSGIPLHSIAIYMTVKSGASLSDWLQIYEEDKKITLQHVAGSASIHRTSGSLKQLLYQDWDMIVVQQASKKAIDYSTISDTLDILTSHIRLLSRNSKVRIAWQMPWAYWTGYSSAPYGYDRWSQIKETLKEIQKNNDIDVFIPVGTAIENARNTSLNTSHDLTRDGLHLSYGTAQYIANCMWYQSVIFPLTHKSLLSSPYMPMISKEKKKESKYEYSDVTSENISLCKICALMAFSDWENVCYDCERFNP